MNALIDSEVSNISQYRGSLIGCAVGDAMGAPVEGKSHLVVEEYIRDHVLPMNFDGVVREQGQHRFGQYTANTQLTRELAISMTENLGFKAKAFGDRLVRLFSERRVIGASETMARAVGRLAESADPYKSGDKETQSNEASVRAAPIGLFYQKIANVIPFAVSQSRLTHQNPLAIAGSVAIAHAAALALLHESPVQILLQVAGSVSSKSHDFSNRIFSLADRVDSNMNEQEILAWVNRQQWDNGWGGISSWMISSVLWSLYSFAKHPDNFMEAIITAIKPGGDVGATAAMTGSLVGARIGLDAIPKELATRVHDRASRQAKNFVDFEGMEDHGYDYLCDLGRNLWEFSK